MMTNHAIPDPNTLTLSSAMKKALDIKKCPLLIECDYLVSDLFYIRYCAGSDYNACGHFKKMMNEIDLPRNWMKKQAIIDKKLRDNYGQWEDPEEVGNE